MAKQTFTTGSVLTATQMNNLQANDYNWTVSQKTASYVLVATDAGTRIEMNAAGSTTVTVNTGLFTAGDSVIIQNIGAGTCTVTAGTATVNKATNASLALAQYQGGTLYFVSASSAIFFPFDVGAATTFVGCFLKKSAVQSITTATPTLISFDQEDFDTDGFHDNVTNNSRITIPSGKDGYYVVAWQAAWSQVDSSGASGYQLYMTKNGSTQIMTNNWRNTGTTPDLAVQNGTTILNLVAGDYITLSCRQDSGSSRNILSSSYQTFFTVAKVG